MSMRRFSTLVLCAFVCIHCSYSTVHGSSCLSCREMQMQENCTDNPVVVKSREGCRGGVVWEPCGCCKVCGKVENESCGGVNGSEGLCDNSLKCTAPQKEFLRGANLTGICLRKWNEGSWMFRILHTILEVCYCVCCLTKCGCAHELLNACRSTWVKVDLAVLV